MKKIFLVIVTVILIAALSIPAFADTTFEYKLQDGGRTAKVILITTTESEVVVPKTTEEGIPVVSIGSGAFAGCDLNLESVIFASSVSAISNDAFRQEAEITIKGVEGSYAEKFAESNGMKFETITYDNVSINETIPAAVINAGIDETPVEDTSTLNFPVHVHEWKVVGKEYVGR